MRSLLISELRRERDVELYVTGLRGELTESLQTQQNVISQLEAGAVRDKEQLYALEVGVNCCYMLPVRCVVTERSQPRETIQ